MHVYTAVFYFLQIIQLYYGAMNENEHAEERSSVRQKLEQGQRNFLDIYET